MIKPSADKNPSRSLSGRLKPMVISTMLATLLGATAPAQAEEGWLDKASNFFSQLIGSDDSGVLNDSKITEGLKQTLSVGINNVVGGLSKAGSFANNPNLKIGLPDSLDGVSSALNKVGMGSWMTDLEGKLNEAAEQAIPAAGPVLLDAVKNMNLEDIQAIYKGNSTAATDYFKKTMSKPLNDAMAPIIKQSLAKVGAMQTFDKIMEKYQSLPFLPKIDSDLIGLVQEKALSGIFSQLGKEEAAIRQDPAKQTTDLLKQLFAAKN